MESYLLKLTTKGLKNLNRDITINFYNETVSVGSYINVDVPRVKGIFGSNGFGKTAIIKSVSIYIDLIRRQDYLFQEDVKKHLAELINKETNEFSFTAFFATYNKKDYKINNILKHEIKISFNAEIFDFKITHEKLSEIKGRTLNENELTIFDSDVGYDNFNRFVKNDIDDEFFKKTNNLLDKNSIIRLGYVFLFEKMASSKGNSFALDANTVVSDILLLYCSTLNIRTVIGKEDTYAQNAINERNKINALLKKIKLSKDNQTSQNEIVNEMIDNSKNGDIVLTKNLSNYEETVKRLYDFIVIFKNDLKNIVVQKETIDSFRTRCVLMFDYGKYLINVNYESAGIRKLVYLFSHLTFCKNGGILFVDELDQCISSVILSKLILYFAEYGKGQICFTSHSLDMLSALNKMKHGIDFINNNGSIVSWTTNGNKQPDSSYKKGLVDGIPFNLEVFDFIKAFGD